MLRALLTVIVVFLAWPACANDADDKVFSGPQPGERLAPFKVRGFFEPDAGKELDFVKQAGGKPILLVFVHDANRQSFRFTKTLTNYSIGVEGLHTGVVWLSDDVTEAENFLKRTGHALARKAPLGISLDGAEGPGVYGLNRNVTLTVLVGKDDKVTASFALIQPSVQADLTKVLKAIAEATGGESATLEDLMIVSHPKLQGSLFLLADRDAKAEDVDRQAAAIEALIKESEMARDELARVTSRMSSNSALSKQGSPKAQEYLKKWSKELNGSLR
jgi:hypothetical protein